MSSRPRDGDDERTQSLSFAGDPRGEARAVLVFWPDGVAAYELPARGTMHIGRAAECEIRIDHPSVSRRHAAIVVGDALEVEDLGSANGTRVGGRRLEPGRRAPLARGALLEIGLATAIVQGSHAVPPRAVRPAAPPAPEGRAAAGAPTIERLEQLVALVAAAPISVLLLGETGVGKEVFAERIHRISPRAGGPLVRINCAALPEPLLESELFGYEKGAFTGAAQRKVGLVEAAHGGTLLLDEVAELPLVTQAKLLRALETREVLPVGATEPRAVDVRFIAATNRDLEERVRAGAFRADLFYRLNGITIAIPPLRDRKGEIPQLAHAFVAQVCAAMGRPPAALAPEALDALAQRDFPGNVRELRNVVERAVVLAAGGPVLAAHVTTELGAPVAGPPRAASRPPPPPPAPGDLRGEMSAIERQRIVEALEACGGNQTEAAKLLGISRRALLSRLDAHALPRPRKR